MIKYLHKTFREKVKKSVLSDTGEDILKAFPWLEFNKQENVVHLRDGRVGVMWKFSDVAIDNADNDDVKVFKNHGVQKLITELPKNGYVQFIREIRCDIKEYKDKMLSIYKKGEPIAIKALEKDLEKFAECNTNHPLYNDNRDKYPYYVKTTENYLTVVTDKHESSQSSNIDQNFKNETKRIKRLSNSIEMTLRTIGVTYNKLDSDAFQGYLERLFNPKTSLQVKTCVYDENKPIYKNILHNNPESDNKSYIFEGIASTILTVTRLPTPKTEAGMLSGEILQGETMECICDTIADGKIIVHLKPLTKHEALAHYDYIFSSHQSTGVRDASYADDAESAKTDAVMYAKRLINEQNISTAKMRIHIVIRGTDQEREIQKDNLSVALKTLGFTVAEETNHGHLIEEQTWPFCFNLNHENYYYKSALDPTGENIADLLPIYGSSIPKKIGLIPYLTDHGQIIPFEPREPMQANHIWISGTTGGGKSVVANRIILGLLLYEKVMLYLIDYGGSIRTLVENCRNSKYRNVDPLNPAVINILYGALTETSKEIMLQMIIVMIEKGSNAKIDSVQRNILNKALEYTFLPKRTDIKIQNESEIEDYINKGYIHGATKLYAWFEITQEGSYNEARVVEENESINTTFRIYRTKPITIRDDFKINDNNTVYSIINVNEDKIKGHFITYRENEHLLRAEQEKEKYGIIFKHDDSKKEYAYVVYENNNDLEEIKRCGLNLICLETEGDVYLQSEVTLSDLKETLSNPESYIEDEFNKESKILGLQLSQFCRGGEFGHYFDGLNEQSWDESKNVYGWDFKNIMERNELVASIQLTALLSQITRRIINKKYEGYTKAVLFDEFWKFVGAGGDAVIKMIEIALRTWRKEDGILIISTQGLKELLGIPDNKGFTLFNQFAHLFFLYQKDTNELLKYEILNEAQSIKFKKMQIANKNYSQFILLSRGDWYKGRLTISKYTYFTLSNNVTDNKIRKDEFNKLRESGMSVSEAMLQAIENLSV